MGRIIVVGCATALRLKLCYTETRPITSLSQLRFPAGALGYFSGLGATVGHSVRHPTRPRFDTHYFRIVSQNVEFAPKGPPHSVVRWYWLACPKSLIVSGKSTPKWKPVLPNEYHG